VTTTSYDQLATPPVDGLDRTSCEYLAYEDSRIVAGVNARASELFATYKQADAPLASNVVFAISVLQDLAQRIQSSAAAYRAAQRRLPNTQH
jgi:hypothetical protein